MGKTITCYLIRHGKTQGNLEKRYIGAKTDESLTEEGIKELENLRGLYSKIIQGDSVNSVNPDNLAPSTHFYSGPMKRCTESMEIIFPSEMYNVVDNLTEINFGDFEGHNYTELSDNPDYQKWIDSNGTMTFPNGEPRADFIKRSADCINEIVSMSNTGTDVSDSDTIVIICHGGNIMSYLSAFTDGDYFDFQCEPGMGYEVKINVIKGESYVITSYNRISDRILT